MASLSDIYTEAVHDNLEPLYANWEPSREIHLGDFGVIEDDMFVYLGNIGSHHITFGERTNNSGDQKSFTSDDSVDVTFTAKGGIPVGGGAAKVSATVEVKFSKKDSVFFNAAGCLYTMIDDKVELGRSIMKQFGSGDWKREWAVVTDLVRASSTTIAVSRGASGSLVLEAAGNVPNIDLADASIALSVKNVSNLGYQVVSQNPIIPLIGLCKIQPTFLFWNDEFQPLRRGMRMAPRARRRVEDSDQVKTEQSPEALFFGQLK